MTDQSLDRRSLLKVGAAGSALLAGAPLAGAMSPFASRTLSGLGSSLGSERKTKHVILVAFAGGVRSKETFGTPANVPNMVAMAGEGVLYPRTRSANLGHFGAAMSMFTGISEPRGIRDNSRGPDPTLFEYCRKDLGLEASDVWIATSGGAQQTNYSYGTNADYGVRYGANTLDGEGIFNREFKSIIDRYGRPREMAARERELLDRLRGSLRSGEGGASLNSAESSARVEQYILDELTRGTVELRGPNAGDAKALRVARNLVALFKPSLVGVVLQNADVAHGSYNAYLDVVRQNDVMLGELWNAVKADEQLADSTAIFVLPEFGRDSDLNARRGLDHGDGSDDLNYVSCVAWGPDFKRGEVVQSDVRAIDVCPTICHLLGADARDARGSRLTGIYS